MKFSIHLIISLVAVIFITTTVNAKSTMISDSIHKHEMLILNKNQPGKTYYYKENPTEGILEYYITYLGSITTSNKHTLNFLFVSLYFGIYEDSKRCRSLIVVYQDGSRLGEYYVGGFYNDIPFIENDEVIFNPPYGDCDLTTSINFKHNIPNKIFIHCKGMDGVIQGDIYTFTPTPQENLKCE